MGIISKIKKVFKKKNNKTSALESNVKDIDDYSSISEKENDIDFFEDSEDIEEDLNDDCPICLDTIEKNKGKILECFHQLHTECFEDLVKSGKKCCPFCSEAFHLPKENEKVSFLRKIWNKLKWPRRIIKGIFYIPRKILYYTYVFYIVLFEVRPRGLLHFFLIFVHIIFSAGIMAILIIFCPPMVPTVAFSFLSLPWGASLTRTSYDD